jgi:nicotinamidase-related amidase
MTSERLQNAHIPDVIPDEDVAYFEKGGHGARMGWGENPALLVVDMTKEFTADEYAAGRSDTGQEAVSANKRLLEAGRASELPVFFTKPDYTNAPAYPASNARKKEPTDDTPKRESGNTVHPELEPRSDEILLTKHRASAFHETPLASMCRYYDVDTLVVTGMTTSGCVRATVVDAFSKNFSVIVPIECTADRSSISHDVTLFDMDMKYADVTPLETVLEKLSGWNT